MNCYVNGTAETAGASTWHFPGLDNISGIAIGRGKTERMAQHGSVDEAIVLLLLPAQQRGSLPVTTIKRRTKAPTHI